MLNIKGAYVVIGAKAPLAVILSESAERLFRDRISVVGLDKATQYQFGHSATNALPCSAECMEFVALNYQGAHEAQVRAMCARIALRQPLGDDSDGGQHARIDAPVADPNAPTGAALHVQRVPILTGPDAGKYLQRGAS